MQILEKLSAVGQAVWFDYIKRSFTESGKLEELVGMGVRGVTSNPSIFEKAIAGSDDYDEAIKALVNSGVSEAEAIYEALALEDIGRAADILKTVYDNTGGSDGYVSLEVSPHLSAETEKTVMEAERLFSLLGKENVMIKVPATPQGIPAIEELIAKGINVNVTLIFSLDQYKAVAEAYVKGLERLLSGGGNPARVASVASVFVSRIDTAVDKALEEKGERSITGKIAVDNSRIIYKAFRSIFSSIRWFELAAAGARVQRPLWASTGTKNPDYPDTLYVDTLIGPDTVNTMPPATLDSFLDHGVIEKRITEDLDGALERIERLKAHGINLDEITDNLLYEGVKAFEKAYVDLLAAIEEKVKGIKGD
ncbi:MAG: transaldolase [Deltaproteobacteria bacterium]|nr:MAG: transaldolase [Deltaproteobacteria bacterium]